MGKQAYKEYFLKQLYIFVVPCQSVIGQDLSYKHTHRCVTYIECPTVTSVSYRGDALTGRKSLNWIQSRKKRCQNDYWS